jgi:hypothetical protein
MIKKNTSNFMKISSAGGELFHADGQKDGQEYGQTNMT